MKKKIKLGKFDKKIKTLPRFLTEHVFGFFMFLVFIGLILGGILFYQYSFLTEKREPESVSIFVQYKENVLKEILNQWSEREENFKKAETKQYPDFFKKEISSPEKIN